MRSTFVPPKGALVSQRTFIDQRSQRRTFKAIREISKEWRHDKRKRMGHLDKTTAGEGDRLGLLTETAGRAELAIFLLRPVG